MVCDQQQELKPRSPCLIRQFRILTTQAGVKAYELRSKSKEQLQEQLVELKKELAQLKVQKLTRPSLPRIHTVRKNIARVLTVINLQQRASVREFYKGKKYIPKDLRQKKTRALRRALTKYEKTQKTDKARKQAIAYPAKKFAVKA
ncbi:hypothetical protein KL907_002670 [Ogataea polymorpha]|nr:hypothetical protein KL937_001654 [Ogataea polymorpha]KAG7905523.1 hypothetical protein KL907_002670 [Ogataea polymorpha]KAG7936604.1 hypothetical protein KL904_002172 [Ogataea polymorpha]